MIMREPEREIDVGAISETFIENATGEAAARTPPKFAQSRRARRVTSVDVYFDI